MSWPDHDFYSCYSLTHVASQMVFRSGQSPPVALRLDAVAGVVPPTRAPVPPSRCGCRVGRSPGKWWKQKKKLHFPSVMMDHVSNTVSDIDATLALVTPDILHLLTP